MGALCDICKELFYEKSDVAALRCGHIYHEKCIKTWLNNSRSCPKCRSPTKTSSIVKLFFSISPDDGIPVKAYLEKEISDLSASIESKCVELKRRMNMAAEADNDLSNIRTRIIELQNRIQDTQMRFLKTTNETYNSLLSEMTNLKNVVIAVKDIWGRVIDHQQGFVSRILEVPQQFEAYKQMLRGHIPIAVASKENLANTDHAPLERPLTNLAFHPNMQSSRESEADIASRQNSINLDRLSLGMPVCSPCHLNIKYNNDRKPNVPSQQNVHLYNASPKLPAYRVYRDRYRTWESHSYANMAPTHDVVSAVQVSDDLPITHLNRNPNMKSNGQSQTNVESVCSTLV